MTHCDILHPPVQSTINISTSVGIVTVSCQKRGRVSPGALVHIHGASGAGRCRRAVRHIHAAANPTNAAPCRAQLWYITSSDSLPALFLVQVVQMVCCMYCHIVCTEASMCIKMIPADILHLVGDIGPVGRSTNM